MTDAYRPYHPQQPCAKCAEHQARADKWQEVLDDSRENLAQTQMECDDLRQTVKRMYRKLADKESDFAKAVHAQIQGWGHNAMRSEE